VLALSRWAGRRGKAERREKGEDREPPTGAVGASVVRAVAEMVLAGPVLAPELLAPPPYPQESRSRAQGNAAPR
jgi:hypothetical protein